MKKIRQILIAGLLLAPVTELLAATTDVFWGNSSNYSFNSIPLVNHASDAQGNGTPYDLRHFDAAGGGLSADSNPRTDITLYALDLGKIANRVIDTGTAFQGPTANARKSIDDESPVPVPSMVWLFGSALIGFIGMSRRTRV